MEERYYRYPVPYLTRADDYLLYMIDITPDVSTGCTMGGGWVKLWL